ncbi:hypothetical protein TSAR_001120 [Trichomalopsis sarcophagae]|uniref:Uncharacterized protein n=1 Tax=Trichomalopsis sarcophagae TaxID=543379 RepID=A0A232EST0_9HYME|nr:hypothetical protein TSAR_001120 [Trichomalopsis sarcophagae]
MIDLSPIQILHFGINKGEFLKAKMFVILILLIIKNFYKTVKVTQFKRAPLITRQGQPKSKKWLDQSCRISKGQPDGYLKVNFGFLNRNPMETKVVGYRRGNPNNFGLYHFFLIWRC